MNTGLSEGKSYLDGIRKKDGEEACRKVLNDTYRKNSRQAAALINDSRLTFPCLYLFFDEPVIFRLKSSLSRRNIIAIRIINQLKGTGASEIDYLSAKKEPVHPVLKWIFDTGSGEEFLDDLYEEVLDKAALVLVSLYEDQEILPLLVDLIFLRNRKGRYIHDLVWALFQIHDPGVLKLIAGHIAASEPEDAALAVELLNLDEMEIPVETAGTESLGREYLRWLEENESYLYFTGESFQYASRPTFCSVDLERKYLQEAASSHERQPVGPRDGLLGESLAAFKALDEKDQKLLSEYSRKIHDENVPAWKDWMQIPVREQVQTALGSERLL